MKKFIAVALLCLAACDGVDEDCSSSKEVIGNVVQTVTVCCAYDPDTGESLGCSSTTDTKTTPSKPIPTPVVPNPYCYLDGNKEVCYANPR